MHYVEALPAPSKANGELVLLIHGFPQTCYQYRHVLTPLAQAGFHVVAPDYRGAGRTSRPRLGYDKATMAQDLLTLVREHLCFAAPVHLVGHYIGGMVAHAWAAQWPETLHSVVWGEACLPGSAFYERTKASIDKFHFIFHRLPDGLAERLVQGNEEAYLQQFFDRLIHNTDAITADDLAEYVGAYSQPDAMRAAMDIYRALPEDARWNIECKATLGKSKVPCLLLHGKQSDHDQDAMALGDQFYSQFSCDSVSESGHYVAEENPTGFCQRAFAIWAGRAGRQCQCSLMRSWSKAAPAAFLRTRDCLY